MGQLRGCEPLALTLFVAVMTWPIAVVARLAEAARAKPFIAKHEAAINPLEIAASLAWWNANTTGSKEDFKRKEEAQNRIDEALSSKTTFAELKAIHAARTNIDDP